MLFGPDDVPTGTSQVSTDAIIENMLREIDSLGRALREMGTARELALTLINRYR
jgi:hypothetical protein